MQEEAILHIENLSKKFGQLQALNGISFQCRKGELFGLLGPNGAGKTTTVRSICSIVKPDTGHIFVNGISVEKEPLRALRKIGVVLEDSGLYARLSAKENMELFAKLHGVTDVEKRINEVCDILEFDEYKNRKFKNLSKGNKQKVLLGQALVIDPPLLILDEPTAGLDVPAQRIIRELLTKIKSKRTILYSTHIMAEAEELCDRLAIIDHGQIIAIGTVSQICKKAKASNLEQAFLKLVKHHA